MDNSKLKKVSRIFGISNGLILFITFSILYKELLWITPFDCPAFYSVSLYATLLIPALVGFILGKQERFRDMIIGNIFTVIVGFVVGVIIFSSFYV